jgi:hypothetical protein
VNSSFYESKKGGNADIKGVGDGVVDVKMTFIHP